MQSGELDVQIERPMLGAGWAKGPRPVLVCRGAQ